jgi:hypothetical protein
MHDFSDEHSESPRLEEGLADELNHLLSNMGAVLAERGHRPSGRRWLGISASLAAAAAVGLLLILPRNTADPPGPRPVTSSTARLEVESSGRFAVFPTNNPDIAVVWLFKEDQ